jgi:hypothetical protein
MAKLAVKSLPVFILFFASLERKGADWYYFLVSPFGIN